MLIADTPYSLPTQTLELAKGLSVAYTDIGEGFPLLFIHGLGSSIPAWSKNIPLLSAQYRCLALDLPGYGKSTKSGFEPGMQFYATIIRDFLDRLQLPECYLVGHSMGGQVVIHTALQYPERVKKLVLAAPAGLETFTVPEAQQLAGWFEEEKVFKAGPEMIEQNMKANFHHFPDDAQTIMSDRLRYRDCTDYGSFCRAISASVSAMLHEPVYEKLSALPMPVLILFGRQDAYIPSRLLHPNLELEEMVKRATARIPAGSYHMLEHCGHFVQWEQAAEFNQQLLKFLS